jgi:Trk K+ transport system NAD-binding subunit
VVPKKTRLVTKSIGELHFPAGACIAGIVRNGKGYVPGPANKFRPGDKAIILILSHAIAKVEKIFSE